MDILTSNCMLLLNFAASSVGDYCQQGVLGHILVATLTALQRTNMYLRSCCVPGIAGRNVTPANLPVSDPLLPGRRSSVSMMRCCGLGEEDDNQRMWEALRTTYLTSWQNGVSTSQHDRYAQDKSCLSMAASWRGLPQPQNLQKVGRMLLVC